jgi:hypothetical protein
MLAYVHGRDPHCKLPLTPGCGMPLNRVERDRKSTQVL